MPLFMDVHNIEGGVSASDVAGAHQADLETQDEYDVEYLRYWVDEEAGKVFCLVEAHSANDAHSVHKEAHGLVADEIYQVGEFSSATLSTGEVAREREKPEGATMTTGTIGERFVQAFLDQDWEEIAGQLTDNVTYRAITSSGVAQFNDNGNAIAKLQSIFEDGDIVIGVETIKTETLPPIERLTYRFQTHVTTSGATRRAEQHVFLTIDDDDKISKLDLLCSGWLPIPTSTPEGGPTTRP
jgi:hypothetical protein